eukprot:gene4682-5848_t
MTNLFKSDQEDPSLQNNEIVKNNIDSNNNNSSKNIKDHHFEVNNIIQINENESNNNNNNNINYKNTKESDDSDDENDFNSSNSGYNNNNNNSIGNNSNIIRDILINVSDQPSKKSSKDDDSDFGDKDEDAEEIPDTIEYSTMMLQILIPVVVTMIIVVATIRAITYRDSWISLSPLIQYNTGSNDDSSQSLVLTTIINSIIFLAVIVLRVFGGFLFILILTYINLPLDYITFVIVVWNFSAGGIVCIFWYSPKILNHGYLISISCLMALFLSRLPEWTTWGIVAIVAIYDIFAVLCPGGPLKQLIDTARKRGESIPALIYNASVYIGMAEIETTPPKPKKKSNSSPNTTTPNINNNSRNGSPKPTTTMKTTSDTPIDLKDTFMADTPHLHENKETSDVSTDSNIDPDCCKDDPNNGPTPRQRSIKLGLGDFVFYSVIIGRAALTDITTSFTSFTD